MSVNSKQKGKRGELEIAKILREYGYNARRGQQYSGASGDPDVIGLKDIHIEVKRTKQNTYPYKWMEQAKHDARIGERPTVFFRRDRDNWLVLLDLKDFLELYAMAYPVGKDDGRTDD